VVHRGLTQKLSLFLIIKSYFKEWILLNSVVEELSTMDETPKNKRPPRQRPETNQGDAESKNAELSIARGEQQFGKKVFLRRALDSLPYPFYVIDASDYTIKLANSAAGFGRLSKTSTCYALTHNTDIPCCSPEHPCPLRTIKETKQPVTVEHLHFGKDGKPVDVEVHAFPIFDQEGNVSHIAEYILDITKRKQAEGALQWELTVNKALSKLYAPLISPTASIESIARIVLEQAKILTSSDHGYVSSINPITGDNVAHTLSDMLKGQCRISGGKRKTVFSPVEDGLSPKLKGHSLNIFKAFFTNSPQEHLSPSGIPEGHIPIYRFLSVPVILGEQLVGQIALANKGADYTEAELKAVRRLAEFYALAIQRQWAQKILQNSEERFRQVAITSQEWIWEVDAKGLYTYSSPVVEKILGWNPSEIIGKKYFYDFFAPDSREQLKKAAFEIFSKKETFKNFIHPNEHKNGNIVILKMSGLPVFDERGDLSGYRGADTDITNRKLAEKKLQQAHKRLNDDIAEAAHYLRTMLPDPIKEGPVQIDWRFIPSASLGGDAFGYHWVDNEYFAIYLIDVCGHGVGAALLSVSVLNLLRSKTLSTTNLKNPVHTLETLNKAFPGEKHNDMFFSLWYGIYNTVSRTLTYASAGHPPALMLSGQKSTSSNFIRLRSHNSVIGWMPNINYQHNIQHVDSGATLYLFSDGVYEITKKDGSLWRLSEFESLLASLHMKEHKTIDSLYNHTVSMAKGGVFDDDYTILKATFE
jgi:sigma-B regulation protein RsbU (phosphoserine phosphatase)